MLSSLVQLDLSANLIFDRGAELIGQELPNVEETLRELDLRGNTISRDVAKHVLQEAMGEMGGACGVDVAT